MSFVRCDACRGQKKVRALGCLMKRCFECQGTGYLEVEEQEQFESDKQVEVKDDKIALSESKKKPSRWVKKDK